MTEQTVGLPRSVYAWQVVHENAALLSLQRGEKNVGQKAIENWFCWATLRQNLVSYDALHPVRQNHGLLLLGSIWLHLKAVSWKTWGFHDGKNYSNGFVLIIHVHHRANTSTRPSETWTYYGTLKSLESWLSVTVSPVCHVLRDGKLVYVNHGCCFDSTHSRDMQLASQAWNSWHHVCCKTKCATISI